MSVVTGRDALSAIPGRFGRDGGSGTSGYSDPRENLAGIMMTQLLMDSPESTAITSDFWTSVYAAIDD